MSDTVNYQLSKSAKPKSQSPVKPRVKSHSSQRLLRGLISNED